MSNGLMDLTDARVWADSSPAEDRQSVLTCRSFVPRHLGLRYIILVLIESGVARSSSTGRFRNMIGVESHTDIHVVRFRWILQLLKWELKYEFSEDWEMVEPNCDLRVNHPATLLPMHASACVICARKGRR